ncbi:MAG: tetratricopeptide repeat protein [Planctomycetes bacterium]|nr:tetratricopeptide repeat protein [Planctomycetota bacterium]
MDLFGMLFGIKKDAISLAIDEALALMEEKNFDGAIAILHEKAFSRNPAHTRARLHLGICHMLKGELDRAEEILHPLTQVPRMDSESAAASIALDKIKADRAKVK